MQLWFSSLAGKDDDFKFRTRDDGDSPESNYSNRDGENTPPCTPYGSQCQLVPELECPEAPRRRRSGVPIPAANVRHLFRKLIVNKVSSFLQEAPNEGLTAEMPINDRVHSLPMVLLVSSYPGPFCYQMDGAGKLPETAFFKPSPYINQSISQETKRLPDLPAADFLPSPKKVWPVTFHLTSLFFLYAQCP